MCIAELPLNGVVFFTGFTHSNTSSEKVLHIRLARTDISLFLISMKHLLYNCYFKSDKAIAAERAPNHS